MSGERIWIHGGHLSFLYCAFVLLFCDTFIAYCKFWTISLSKQSSLLEIRCFYCFSRNANFLGCMQVFCVAYTVLYNSKMTFFSWQFWSWEIEKNGLLGKRMKDVLRGAQQEFGVLLNSCGQVVMCEPNHIFMVQHPSLLFRIISPVQYLKSTFLPGAFIPSILSSAIINGSPPWYTCSLIRQQHHQHMRY